LPKGCIVLDKKNKAQILNLDNFNSNILNFAKEQKLKNDLEILKLQKQNKDFEEIINHVESVLEKAKPTIQNITNHITNCENVITNGKGNKNIKIDVETIKNFTSN